jgi:hypothetical protein
MLWIAGPADYFGSLLSASRAMLRGSEFLPATPTVQHCSLIFDRDDRGKLVTCVNVQSADLKIRMR